MDKRDLKSMNFEQVKAVMEELGEKAFRAKQIYEWMHTKLIDSFDEMTNLSKALRDKLSENFELTSLRVVDKRESAKDGTCKFLFELSDNRVIESVLMKYKHGNSVCISSQVGCRMGCRFCASTLGGLERNLTPAEMLDQIYKIQKMSGERVSNVVLMGTGEPLDNYDNVLQFIQLLTDENGLNISQRNITVSTCGLVNRIRDLANEELQITLAISLHAPNDKIRKEIMPIANKYTINEIIDAVTFYYNKTGRRISFEYSLVEGVNDSEENAKELIHVVRGLNCHVNLIPVNPIKERDFKQTQMQFVQNFKNILEKNRINVTIRREMGSDIDAACGQLRKSYMDEHTT
ncbi:23S rRNA (adenine2503-C2)-methyltransferase [Anaerosporobacter mobilis DSM 15930]|jgi:23S rRNA (adenine2503-C2)-methyltransferase|uniref:Probable dual-specificity RNA methyltransferase RlmN n=1 Tax=Anaerosporobacter mobilis DSM 15930 TaxID=1120996 RepID=A0A1M7F0D8_9FIRM|nr:23S rRNA (adenine(2503)-C(2))-methyltransferase RlmN [Anaerosporobacter mobilis]SHL97247.1 23S rRNA (adenine2503-C2)-methyltransferase [Anaerosporobacter mobilis DSM 15930]